MYGLIALWFGIAVLAAVAFGDPFVQARVKVTNEEPKAIVAGEPYVVNLMVTKYGRAVHNARPLVTVSYAGGTFSFRATERGHDGFYSARVRVPAPGKWQSEVRLGKQVFRKRTFKVQMP